MVGPVANRVLDKLHQATVGVLVLSTLYFGVEAFRATWYIQKHKAEQRVSKSASAFITSLACDFVIVKRTSCMSGKSARAATAPITAASWSMRLAKAVPQWSSVSSILSQLSHTSL